LGPLRAIGIAPEQIVGRLAANCGLSEPGSVISAAKLVEKYQLDEYGIMPAIRYIQEKKQS